MEIPAELTDPTLIQKFVIPWAIRLGVALAIFIIGKWVARIITRAVQRIMGKAGMDAMLARFLGNILYAVLLVAVIIAAVDQLGVNTTSLLAVFGAAGLAVGLALQNSLSNFSPGVILIILRPFNGLD